MEVDPPKSEEKKEVCVQERFALCIAICCRLGNLQIEQTAKFNTMKIFCTNHFNMENFLTVGGYKVDKCLERLSITRY